MVWINGTEFQRKPLCCYECPFFLHFGMMDGRRESQRGSCTLFGMNKNAYANLAKRCRTLFDKAFTYPDGEQLAIIMK